MATISNEHANLVLEFATRIAKVRNIEKTYNGASEGGYKDTCFADLLKTRANLQGFKDSLELQGILVPIQSKAEELIRMFDR